VAPPPATGGWDVRFSTSNTVKGWEWQYEVTAGGRIWYCIRRRQGDRPDDERKRGPSESNRVQAARDPCASAQRLRMPARCERRFRCRMGDLNLGKSGSSVVVRRACTGHVLWCSSCRPGVGAAWDASADVIARLLAKRCRLSAICQQSVRSGMRHDERRWFWLERDALGELLHGRVHDWKQILTTVTLDHGDGIEAAS
jgi:hypothetical protein